MAALRAGLKYYIAASLLEAGMFACMAATLVLLTRDAPVMLTLAPILPATLLGLVATSQLRKVGTMFDQANRPPATGGTVAISRWSLAVATLMFFAITTVSTFACTLLLLYSIPVLRPSDDFLAVALLLSVSVTYSIFMSAFFFGAVGRYTV
jgi:hypothetical protein